MKRLDYRELNGRLRRRQLRAAAVLVLVPAVLVLVVLAEAAWR